MALNDLPKSNKVRVLHLFATVGRAPVSWHSEPDWHGCLSAVDLRALSPLKWQHINPYGTFTLNMSERLPLA
jgi:hypothetical protein